MTETVRQIHNMAMELSQLAELKKAKDGAFPFYENYLKAAYELELYAALKIKEDQTSNDPFWRATLVRSAGWLAFHCGYYEQAKRLAIKGLAMRTDTFTLSKLKELKNSADEKLKSVPLIKKDTLQTTFRIYGFLSSADVENYQINIREKKSKQYFSIRVSKNQMQRISHFFLGEKVEIEATKDEAGAMILEDIQWGV